MKLKGTIFVAVLCLFSASLVFAQNDPPGRVARINYMDGTVSYRPDAVPDWSPASINFPLTNGDHLWTDNQSHLEMHIGSKAIRMADETAISVLNLDDRVSQLSLSAGALNVHVGFLASDETFEVDTPNGAVTLLRAGTYRLDVNPEANFTAVTVISGDAEVTAGGQAFPVHARQQGHFSGSDQVGFDVVAAPAPDYWDGWCTNRDQNEMREVQAASVYLPREMVGAEDLGRYGTWRTDPRYGPVWIPNGVVAGWEPYRYGHWAYVNPWGWTWIDDAAWGFAPFHYGRWAFVDGTWLWVPGRRVERPVYAPALVAFVGGPRFGVSIGFGGGGVAAWVVLGPGEVFRPAYHHSDAYIREVNVNHVSNITVINQVNVTNVTYVNQTHVVAVPQAAFAGARPVGAVAIPVPAAAMQNAHTVEASTMQPTRASFVGRPMAAGAAVRVAAPPAAAINRPVVVRNTPPPTAQGHMVAPTRPANPGGGAFVAGSPHPAGAAAPAAATAPANNYRPGNNRPGMQPAAGAQPAAQNAQPAGQTQPVAPRSETMPRPQAVTPQAQPQNVRPATPVPTPQPQNVRPVTPAPAQQPQHEEHQTPQRAAPPAAAAKPGEKPQEKKKDEKEKEKKPPQG